MRCSKVFKRSGSLKMIYIKQIRVLADIPPHLLRRNRQGIRKLSEIADFRELLVRVEGLEPPT